ncbi:hypothetical protein AOCH_006532 [Aspergillus ochraceoroseus]|uniref:Sorting nexin MVP1 n=1 Tax=Aspergillus ochraceoroseus TaxID=138278 RepID=A0A0F8UX89_9EURO|nr:hypothetical protein AOCH_006532 [Aspergillus ochraceoroseus]
MLDEQATNSHDALNNVHVGSPASHASPPVAMLDPDPNADRRKRRKTSNEPSALAEDETLSVNSNPPLHLSSNLATSDPVAETRIIPEPYDSAPPTNAMNPSGDKHPSPQPSANHTNSTPSSSVPDSNTPTKRIILKLNPNGKLLSSPVADKLSDRSKKAKGNKRGKQGQKKVVVIKYSNKGVSEILGKKIDDIINGRAKFTPTSLPAIPTPPESSAPKKTQPPKPTHPFFLKKAIRKSEISPPHSPSHDSTPTESEREELWKFAPSRPPSSFFSKAPVSFRQSLKFPEPIYPIWPPRGLTHVRDISDINMQDEDLPCPVEIDHRKSKMAAIQIHDSENVLSLIVNDAGESRPLLRIPQRQVTSGLALQTIMAEQLSGLFSKSSTNEPGTNYHPAIVKLNSSLLSSMTAFDRGEFDTHTWAQKYAPNAAPQVLCATKEAFMLRDWLKNLMVLAVDTGKPSKENEKTKRKAEEKKRKRRKKSDKLDGFIVSSEDEASEMDEVNGSDDELAGDVTVSNKRTVVRSGDLTFHLKSGGDRGRMSNAILLSGPSGCGKTASVYAVAKELDFEVFEINAGSRRSAKDIVDRIGDMAQNHLVHGANCEEPTSNQPLLANSQSDPLEDSNQSKLMGFFKAPTAGPPKTSNERSEPDTKKTYTKRARSQRQSLILLEEVDLLFEEDKQFWSGVLTLINQSKRPIVITCNDESLLPLDDISFHAILRYRAPPPNLAVDYLLLVAANEGHVLKRKAVEKLYRITGHDLRRSIMELNFWCQMAVGSEKSGLDWMMDRWPRGTDLDANGDPLRVLSIDTYQEFMGWFSRDMLVGSKPLASDLELQREAFHWWQLSFQESESMEDSHNHSWSNPDPNASKLKLFDHLCEQSDFMAMRSAFDVLTAGCSPEPRTDAIDFSIPFLSEKQNPNYIEGYQLLNADHMPDYTALPIEIGSACEAFIGKAFRQERDPDVEAKQARKVLEAVPKPRTITSPGMELFEALGPVIKPDYALSPNGRAEPSFEYTLRSVAEDLVPYVRSIITFDLRLEQYRLELSGLLSGGSKGPKRIRTTRASRAALEGGSKAETRKERWFTPNVNPSRILATGMKEWQELLVQNGYFAMPSTGQTREENDSSAADSAQRSKSSLFADEPSFGAASANFGSSSLFADDDGLDTGSPWNSNTGKRTSKQQLVRTLLPDTDVPENYIDAFDLVLSLDDRVGTGISLTAVREILSGGGISATDQAKILNLVISGEIDRSNGLGRGEFSVLLALMGLAQEGEDLTFDTVDDRRKTLPPPKSSYLDSLRAKQDSTMSTLSHERPTTPPPSSHPLPEPSSVQSRRSGRDSMGGLESDPWGSPQLHRGHAHAQTEHEHGALNGYGSVRSTTNAWSSGKSTDGGNPSEPSNLSRPNGRSDVTPSSAGSGFGWGDSFGHTSDGGGLGGPVRAGLGGDFSQPGSDPNESNPRRVNEMVTVTLLQEKEGMFMFQHRNYEVKSARRCSTVVRRYSDFVWLLDCLHKRYPFRQLPLLPPKRISVNGTHLAADSTSFLEKRRRGLVRFTNALVQHPVLSQEQLVVMFLTVPTELSVWRKQATISVQDEFMGRVLPPDLEDSLPSTLSDTFDTVRTGVKRSAEGLAADHLRFSLALQSLTEMTRDTYAIDRNDVPLLNDGIQATARHLSASQTLLEDEARAWENGVLEDLKRQRDCLVSVREMFDRRDRYARNNIPQLERRIESNERKLQDLRTKPPATVKAGEIEKVEESIFKDKESIVQQHARGVFIQECLRDELVYFQQSQYHISRLHQDWSQERVKYSELQADNWRSLSDQVEGMPLGE